MNNSFDVNVLVNGNRCKFYHHNGKTYIEAKHSSEYELEIKNNTWSRILCLSSVDGLNVLNGTTMHDDSPGYLISAHSPLRIKGFRYSNDEVAAFKFTNKEDSYANAIGGSEAAENCGVIGFKIWNEYINPHPTIKLDFEQSIQIPVGELYRYNTKTTHDFNANPFVGMCYGNSTSASYSSARTYNSSAETSCLRGDVKCSSFDMGSSWGQKIESKVVETSFEKGSLIFALDIYYASRRSLINMGVPINVGNQIVFPESFPSKFATPPSGWRG